MDTVLVGTAVSVKPGWKLWNVLALALVLLVAVNVDELLYNPEAEVTFTAMPAGHPVNIAGEVEVV